MTCTTDEATGRPAPEFLEHAHNEEKTPSLTAEEIVEPKRADSWLDAAHSRRTTPSPTASPSPACIGPAQHPGTPGGQRLIGRRPVFRSSCRPGRRRHQRHDVGDPQGELARDCFPARPTRAFAEAHMPALSDALALAYTADDGDALRTPPPVLWRASSRHWSQRARPEAGDREAPGT